MKTRLLIFLALGLGLAGGGLSYWLTRQRAAETIEKQPAAKTIEISAPIGGLSESTMKILAALDTPIDLRLFAPADVSVLPAALGGYVTRIERLLAEYQRVAAGKVRVIKCDPRTDAAAKAAAGAAGVAPFGTGNGEIIYLGLTAGNGSRSETVAPLAPEWEAALESDVSRAISRVAASTAAPAQPVAQKVAMPTPMDPAVSEELLKAFPDLASRSYDDVAQVLREGALAEFKSAAIEMEAKVQRAEQGLAEARQNNKSEAEQQAALKEFQQAQSEQANTLKQITARLQERLTALQRLKGVSGRPTPPR